MSVRPAAHANPRRSKDRGARGRYWCITSFAESVRSSFDEKHVRYVIYQWERTKTQALHVQAYMEFYEVMRIGQVQFYFGDPKAHCEVKIRSRTVAREYCRKKESAIPHTVHEWGTWREEVNRKRKLIEVLKDKAMTLDRFIEDVPHFFVMYRRGVMAYYNHLNKKAAFAFRVVKVTVLVGPTGVGKTRRACSGPYGSWYKFPKSGKLWFDNYAGEKRLVLDEFNGKETMPLSYLLEVLDGYAFQAQIKGDFTWARWTEVVITSNTHPKDWYPKGKPMQIEALHRRIHEIVIMAFPVAEPVVAEPVSLSDEKHGGGHARGRDVLEKKIEEPQLVFTCEIHPRPVEVAHAPKAVLDALMELRHREAANQLACWEVLEDYESSMLPHRLGDFIDLTQS